MSTKGAPAAHRRHLKRFQEALDRSTPASGRESERKQFALREKVLLQRLRDSGNLVRILDRDRADLRTRLKRKTQRAEEPASAGVTASTAPPKSSLKRTRLCPSAPFVSIGQVVWDAMMQFYAFSCTPPVEIDTVLMHLSESDLAVPTSQPEPSSSSGQQDSDEAALQRFFEDQERPPTESATLIIPSETSNSSVAAPPGLVFNIGDDLADQLTDRRSSLANTYGDMDWSLNTTRAMGEKTSVGQKLVWCDSLQCSHTADSLKTFTEIASTTKENAEHPTERSLDDEDHLRSTKLLAELVKAREEEAREQSPCGYFSNDNVCWKESSGLGGGVSMSVLADTSHSAGKWPVPMCVGYEGEADDPNLREEGNAPAAKTIDKLFYDGSRLLPGTAIRLQGLISAPHFNGRTGNVCFRDEAKGKYQIKLDDGSLHTIAHERLEVLSSYEDIIRLSEEDQKRPDNWNDENTGAVLTSETLAARAASRSGPSSSGQIDKEAMIDKLSDIYNQQDAVDSRETLSVALASGLTRKPELSKRPNEFLKKKFAEYPICQQTEVFDHLRKRGTYLPTKTVYFKEKDNLRYPEDFTDNESYLVSEIFKLLGRGQNPTLRHVEEEFRRVIKTMMSEIPKTSLEDWINNRVGEHVEVHDELLLGSEVKPQWISWRATSPYASTPS